MLREGVPEFTNILSKKLTEAIAERGMTRRLRLSIIKDWIEKQDFNDAQKMVKELGTIREVDMFLGCGVRGRLYELGIVRKVQLESPS